MPEVPAPTSEPVVNPYAESPSASLGYAFNTFHTSGEGAAGTRSYLGFTAGVNIGNWKIAVYALAGAVCGVAGILIASRINSAQPAIGQGYELDAIAAVVIGGTSLSGGRGTMLGTMIGALIISVVANGLRILSVPQEWQIVVTGSIIILAVYLDILRRRGI